MSESLKQFHDDFIRFFQTREKHETNLLACQILLYATTDPYFKKYDVVDSHTNYFQGDVEYVNEFIEDLFKHFSELIDGIFPEFKKFVDDTIKICRGVMPGYLLLLFRKLCRLNEQIDNLNSALFDEFYSYTNKTKQRNSEWTPETICKIFTLLVKDYYPKKDIKTLFDPCIGANKLVHSICKNLKINPVVYGLDVVPVLCVMSYFDLIKQNTDFNKEVKNITNKIIREKIKIYCRDMFTFGHDDLFDLCVCNPPYTKKLSNHDALEFVIKSMTLSKHGIFIFPSNQIRGMIPQVQQELLKIATVDRVLVLGSKVFNGIGAGDICIMCCSNKKVFESSEAKVQNINYYDYINRVPHALEDTFKPEKKAELINIISKLENAKTIITNETLNWCGEINLFTLVRDGQINIEGFKNMSDIEILKRVADKEILQNLKNSCPDLNLKNIKQKILETEEKRKFLRNLPEDRFKKVKLCDVFKLQEKTKTVKAPENLNKTLETPYPVISATKLNNGICGYIDKYDFEASTDKPLYTIAKDGTAGIIFKHTYKFSKISHVLLLTPLINLQDINIIILTTQLINMGFGFNKSINKDAFNNIEVYIYI